MVPIRKINVLCPYRVNSRINYIFVVAIICYDFESTQGKAAAERFTAGFWTWFSIRERGLSNAALIRRAVAGHKNRSESFVPPRARHLTLNIPP